MDSKDARRAKMDNAREKSHEKYGELYKKLSSDECLKKEDTRKAYYPHELPDDLKEELEKGYQGES